MKLFEILTEIVISDRYFESPTYGRYIISPIVRFDLISANRDNDRFAKSVGRTDYLNTTSSNEYHNLLKLYQELTRNILSSQFYHDLSSQGNLFDRIIFIPLIEKNPKLKIAVKSSDRKIKTFKDKCKLNKYITWYI